MADPTFAGLKKVRHKGKKWYVVYDWGQRIMIARRRKKSGRIKAMWLNRKELDA